MRKNTGKLNNNSGFSLIEILIVIFFLGIGLVGILAFFNSSISSHTEAKNELIAAGLAQEGAELVRNLRDYKVLHDSATWDNLVDNSSGLPACQRIDFDSLSGSHVCDNTKSIEICLDANKRYKQCAGGSSGIGFLRTIDIQCENASNVVIGCSPTSGVKSLRVTSTVIWNDRTTAATDRLYENEY